MAPFHLESFLGAARDPHEEIVNKHLSLIHLGAELLELEIVLRRVDPLGKPPNEHPKAEPLADNLKRPRWMFWKQ